MSDPSTKDSFLNWQEYSCELGHVEALWSDEYKQFTWQETFMIDEIPHNDVWNTSATSAKLELESFFRRQQIPKECTRHYMSLHPTIPDTLQKILNSYVDHEYHYNFLKLTPACSLVWHYDTYATFVKHNNITDVSEVRRTAVMLEDWSIGQIIQIGNSFLHQWKKGDTFSWKGDTWHGAANFGYQDLVLMQITWK